MTEYINGVPVAEGGAGDMTKAVYDTDENDVVDNSEKLEGSTKAQVQDHTPKAHTAASHSDQGATGAELEVLTDGSETTLHSHAVTGWLSGWDKRIKLTIDSGDIDAALSDFPTLVYLSTASGIGGVDVSAIFDELTSDGNRKKIAITTSDGETQCYVEIEKWVDADEKAWLWVKVPSIASDADTILYLYYDVDHADNDSYVGDPSDAVVHNVWDSNFKLVTHMRDDPDTSHIRDSTVNANDGTKGAPGEPAVTAGKIDGAQQFDGTDDKIIGTNPLDLDAQDITMAVWVYFDDFAQINSRVIGIEDADYSVQIVRDGGSSLWVTKHSKWEAALSGRQYSEPAVATWYYVVAVFDVTGETTTFYVDGSPVSGNPNNNTGVGNQINNYYLGVQSNEVNTTWLKGRIDEVRVSSTSRTAAWIKASYESERDDLLAFGNAELAAHKANTTTAHGAVSAATASKFVVRDASARAKFAQSAAAGDAIVADANNRAPDSTLLEGSSKATVQDHTPKAHTLDSHSTKAHSELSDAPEGAHHTKFTTTEHTSIGNGAPHHTKYTDANARTAAVSDTIYGGGWNGVTTIAPSKNAVWDKIEALGGGGTTATVFLNEQESPSYGNTVRALCEDEDYVYIAGITVRTIKKYDKITMALVLESPNYGGDIYALTEDTDYVYATGGTVFTVKKFLKSDMTLSLTSPSYGADVFALCEDSGYVYAGGLTANEVRKYDKSDMTLADSYNYGGIVWALTEDTLYVYATGDADQTVKKILKSDMSLSLTSPDYGSRPYALINDDGFVYEGGTATTGTVQKFDKSDMTLAEESPSYGGIIYALAEDDDYIYAGGTVTETIRRYRKSDMVFIDESPDYGGTIRGIGERGHYIFISGETAQTIKRFITQILIPS